MKERVYGFKVFRESGRPLYGNKKWRWAGKYLPTPARLGAWTPPRRRLQTCRSGWHIGSLAEARGLRAIYPLPLVFIAEADGRIIFGGSTQLVAERIRLIERVKPTDTLGEVALRYKIPMKWLFDDIDDTKDPTP